MNNRVRTEKKTPKTRSDTAVQGTNDSSIISKCSAAAQGYVSDDYTKYMVAKSARRAPLINRGYYIRAKVMEHIFNNFLEHYAVNNQILVLGAGFDAAYFNLAEKRLLNKTVYFEVDFPEVVERKQKLIEERTELRVHLNDSRNTTNSPHIVIDSEHYKLLGVDLTNHQLLESTLHLAGFDLAQPTLIISEVVLTYMTAKSSSAVIEWAASFIENGVFLAYEQVYPEDAFGQIMLKHFDKIGSTLRCIQAYPTIQSQVERYKSLEWTFVQGVDLSYFYKVVLSADEKLRVMQLEPFDEFEEWHSKCMHYMVLTAFKGTCVHFSETVWSPVTGNDLGRNDGMFSSDHENICAQSLPDIPLAAFDSRGIDMDDLCLKSQRYGHTSNMILMKNSSVRWMNNDTKSSDDIQNVRDEYILLIGGFGQKNSHHGRLKNLEIFSSATGSTPLSGPQNLPGDLFERMYHTATNLSSGNEVVVIGGRQSPAKPCDMRSSCLLRFEERDNGDISYQCQILDRDTGIIPSPRWRHSATAVTWDGCEHILVIGGRNLDAMVHNDAFLLNTQIWVWQKIELKGCYREPTHSHTADRWHCDHRDLVILSGGLNTTEIPQATVYSLDVGTWTLNRLNLAGMIRPRYGHSSIILKDHLFLVGGVSLHYPPPGVAVVNLQTDAVQEYRWTIEKSLCPIIMTHNHSSMLSSGSSDAVHDLLVIGGGGNCFSFGTHLNEIPRILDLNFFLKDFVKREKLLETS